MGPDRWAAERSIEQLLTEQTPAEFLGNIAKFSGDLKSLKAIVCCAKERCIKVAAADLLDNIPESFNDLDALLHMINYSSSSVCRNGAKAQMLGRIPFVFDYVALEFIVVNAEDREIRSLAASQLIHALRDPAKPGTTNGGNSGNSQP